MNNVLVEAVKNIRSAVSTLKYFKISLTNYSCKVGLTYTT